MEVGIAILGSGFVSDFYMNGLKEVVGHKVVVNYSRSEKRAKQFAEQWNIPNWTSNMEEAVKREDVQLVLIGLPNDVHLQATRTAANAKKNVVCTKPLGRNAAEAKEMLDLVKKAGVLHGYAETEVFSPAVIRVRELIEAGGIGNIFSLRSREAHSGPHAPQFWDPEKTGGGALMDMGCHMFEAFRYFLGKENKPVECIAWGDNLVHKEKTTAEDNAVAMIRFESGAVGVAEVSWAALGGMDLRNEVYGDKGSAFTDITRGTPIRAFTTGSAGYVMEKATTDNGWIFPVPDEARVYGYHEEMKHFVECIAENKMPRETYEDGYTVNQIMDACYKSMKTKKWEKIEISGTVSEKNSRERETIKNG
ncbi:Gfo/Idh/MocA family protein [Fictibacillus terranigra]|uniref:Gfo/Idh/MocA family oxidoreductase n=1 Tax=Fictibacillus terranigra TaxID=3058424 RepID=A0ABT8EDM0_9BACL|nr:Gfo/Idh/MocA family oxidoreductase [Fictibacillus sp. CENA-BCM004]MDN4076020.1 Gfo/Idh/MocA family oxidoreductase [Fictibacillus sp. CENA-BCM004]